MSTEAAVSRKPSALAIRIGIYNETDPLRVAAVWGPLGAEAVLAQVYPKYKSLFFDDMNVPLAREEALSFRSLLEGYGVQVVPVRDSLVNYAVGLFGAARPSRQSVRDRLQERAVQIFEETREDPGSISKSRLSDLTDQVDELLEGDYARYGEIGAAAINKLLCLDQQMPLGNLLYGRDQMNVLLGTRIVSSMAKPIRRGEVDLYEVVYGQILDDHKKIQMPAGETFEGGDAYVHNGYVYVGVGDRTTMGGALSIYKGLRPEMDKHGLRFVIVEDSDPASRSQSDRMDFMHLDTFSNPLDDTNITVCTSEAEYRRVRFVSTSAGEIIVGDGNRNFLDHLEAVEDDIIPVSVDEQQSFGVNFLALDSKRIIVPRSINRSVNTAMRRHNKEVVTGNLDETTKGYGAAHCITGQLRRSVL